VRIQLGTPTILINNAAVVIGKKLLDMDVDEIDKSLKTNLLSHFYTIKTFLPGMIDNEAGGTIVTMSSVIGHVGAAQLADYAAAKAGVTALHKSLAAELQEYPEIKTILVTPGQLSTPLFYGVKTPSSFIAPVVEPIEVAKEIIKAIDLGLSDHIGMPLYARWIDWYNVLPVGLQKITRKLSGMDKSMKTFVGRKTTVTSEKNGTLI
jgi:NAD(P)-dependent dehydrogenase (short-subunit alcohol dehydrogenase family)